MGRRCDLKDMCQKPDRQGGPVSQVALPDGRASDTTCL